jgi:UDP:flavonoid glycosyltransferase YjiC (YdhE family)
VRVLFATTAGAGHLGPLVPFASACAASGHEVTVAAPASFADAVGRAGLVHVPFADAPAEELGPLFAGLPGLTLEEANEVVMRDVFAGVDARAALAGVAEIVRGGHPDVIVREAAEFASYVVAEQQHVPHAQVAIGPAGLDEFALPRIDGALRALGAAQGADGLRGAPVLTLVPEVLDDPRAGDGAVHRFRYEPPPAGRGGPLPAWGDPDAPLVYATFGTVAAGLGLFPDLYRAAVDAVADLPVRMLLTIGEAGDPGALDPLPGNVRVERFRPQTQVMPAAAAMIGHGGFGTTMTGLAQGVPMVVTPLFALDQHLNAAAVARSGAGVVVDGGPAAPDALARALTGLLADPSYRTRAHTVAGEIASLPAAAMGVAVLERIAAGADRPS